MKSKKVILRKEEFISSPQELISFAVNNILLPLHAMSYEKTYNWDKNYLVWWSTHVRSRREANVGLDQ